MLIDGLSNNAATGWKPMPRGTPMHIVIFGCGYLGARAARLWQNERQRVTVVTRSPQRALDLAATGLEPIVADVSRPETLSKLPACDLLLYSIGYDRTATASRQAVTVDGLRAVQSAIADRCGKWIQISSTSVYGQTDGGWVDEDSACQPTEESGQLQLAAEQIVRENSRALILRLSGIYGPGRLLTRIESLRAQEPLNGDPEGWLNLIHVDDAARIVCAAAERGSGGKTYLVSDDQPIRRREYYGLLAQRLELPPPRFGTSRGPRGNSNKRCRNGRLQTELQVTLQYPTIATGLPAATKN